MKKRWFNPDWRFNLIPRWQPTANGISPPQLSAFRISAFKNLPTIAART
jgi:hypothetical protein